MHIYFSAIGGTGIGPLALVAQQAGYRVSGSDKQESQYIAYLRTQGITDIHIDQSYEMIAKSHEIDPIDWYVYSSAVVLENPNAPELRFCREQSIKVSKRDELLNEILSNKKLNLIAVAGTHGKTTTTAMVVWLCTQLALPISYILPAKTSFAEMGAYNPKSNYFVYEADEFDRNFLAFEPELSLITGVSWDHHEIFKTREDYQAAFKDFINQSKQVILWQDDADYLSIAAETSDATLQVQVSDHDLLPTIGLKGFYNRLDAWLAIQAVHEAWQVPIADAIQTMQHFPGLQRRMEQLVPNLYSDYAHTPEKIRGAMSVANELASESGQPVVVVYEPLTNRRQHFMQAEYKDCFAGASKLYWVPSYLAREDPSQAVLTPEQLLEQLADPSIAQAATIGSELEQAIKQDLSNGAMVVGMAGGGGSSLDEWLRRTFQT